MTDESVDCFNCGRANPEWAQVCRSCGVALRHGEERVVSTGPVPTDRDSIISMAAVIGTILGAVLLGLFISGLNPTEPSVGQPSPTPQPTIAETSTPEPTVQPSVAPSVAPTAAPTPTLPGTLTFGNEIGDDGQVVETVETFTPGMNFAYSVSVPENFGATPIQNEVVRINEEDTTTVLEREGVNVDPASSRFSYVIGRVDTFIAAWGPGEYEWRVYVEDAPVARARFRLAEG